MSWDWEKLKEQQKRSEMPPQMDDLLKKFSNFKMPGGSYWILILIVILIAPTLFFTVAVDEVGIIQRFGEFNRICQPGLNFKFPTGVEKVTKVKIRRVYKEEFGFRTVQPGERATFSADTENNIALMLTGDLNVAIVPWIVQYRIDDPYKFLFKVNEVNRLLRDMSEASMRMVVGDRSINEVINKREEIADEAKGILQRELDLAEAGISVVTIEMKETNVPERVQPSFNEVNQSVQEKEKMIYQAREEYNKEIPAARGEAERTIRTAEGYVMDRVNRAKGDASRFLALYEEYSKAKEITKNRLYLEAMKSMFPKLGQKYIIDADQKNILPLLNLNKQSENEK